MTILLYCLAALGALWLLVFALLLLWVLSRAAADASEARKMRAASRPAPRGGPRDRPRRKMRLPLLAVRVLTWRKRRDAPGGTAIDSPSIPLTPAERKALKEMR